MPDAVHYAGDAVTHTGALWQATKDTGQAPPHADWICLAAAGQDGITPTIRGTYDPAGIYARLDIVALNNSSFIARKDQPGLCPGEDWQLIVGAGKQGRPGPRGAKGERGEPGSKGDPGAPAPTILAWKSTARAIGHTDHVGRERSACDRDARAVRAIPLRPRLTKTAMVSSNAKWRSDVSNPLAVWNQVCARAACRAASVASPA